MPAEHETMTAEQIEALKIWTPYWSDADCRNAIAAIASLQAALAVSRKALEDAESTAAALLDKNSHVPLNLAWRGIIGATRGISENAIETIDAAPKGAHPAQGGENVG